MKISLQQVQVRGPARMKYLFKEAAESLIALEKDTDGLVYLDIWRDPVASLLARRTRKSTQLPGYSGHNYGLSVDLDLKTILDEKKVYYEDIIYMLKKRGWYCHRRDGDPSRSEAEHFVFLGLNPKKYLDKATLEPGSWQRPTEDRIYDLYGEHFNLNLEQIQDKLELLGFFIGPTTTTIDAYLREAILAFQRAWDLIEDGTPSMQFQRVLAFVAAEIELLKLPTK